MFTSTRARNSSGSTVSVPAVGLSDLPDRYATAFEARSVEGQRYGGDEYFPRRSSPEKTPFLTLFHQQGGKRLLLQRPAALGVISTRGVHASADAIGLERAGIRSHE